MLDEIDDEQLDKLQETHGVETAFYDRSTVTEHTAENKQIQHANEVFNEYDSFAPGDLEKLAQDTSFEGREKLKEIAEKYDIPVDDGTTPESIIGRIINAMNSQDAPNWFLGSE